MKPVRLYRIGSDPEFVFTKIQEWQHTVIGADTVITKNKAAALQSFIGVDGHAATAELRPTPAHNVHRHMLDIAAAITAVDDFLKKKPELVPVALPFVGAEPLGGHIHVSFFVDDPGSKYAWEHNYISSWGKLVMVDQNKNASSVVDVATLEIYNKECARGQLPSPSVVLDALNYLIMPFEAWIQPWPMRRKRNAKYGESPNTQIRWMNSKRPDIEKFNNHGYHHYEYRSPSTWLAHPWIAYVYFALTKLVMLNLEAVYTAHVNNHDEGGPVMYFNGNIRNEDCRLSFQHRLEKLEGLKITNDIKDLQKAVDYCGRFRTTWLDPFKGIDMKAWRELIS